MRTKAFTFKKTKRIKVVTEHPAISVDLTCDEAAVLIGIMDNGSVEYDDGEEDKPAEAMAELYNKLRDFVATAPSPVTK